MSDIIRHLEKEDSVKEVIAELSQRDDITDIAVVFRTEDGVLSRRWVGDFLRLITACRIFADDMQSFYLTDIKDD